MMFAERLDALMNIAEVSNTMLGRAVHIDSSHIGRLRAGTRPLPKKHDYLSAICRYLVAHCRKEYQIKALQKLTAFDSETMAESEELAFYLEQWLLAADVDFSAATGRLISGFLGVRPTATFSPIQKEQHGHVNESSKDLPYLYGNAGKRRAVEQFFLMILEEKQPQTLLLFSDENMAWLYEDPVFAARWLDLFKQVILKGNRVRIIHTVSRDINELLEAVTKWVPIYMTGMIEPFYYPRLRDGVFQRTLFIAPRTAAVISSSVQQNTDGMLHFFLTDSEAIHALTLEYQHYLLLCRPLMRIITGVDSHEFQKDLLTLALTDQNARLCCAIPPLFSMPETLVKELAQTIADDNLYTLWQSSHAVFMKLLKKQHLSLALLDPKIARLKPEALKPTVIGAPMPNPIHYTPEQYDQHIAYLQQLEKQYDCLSLTFRSDILADMLLYVKDGAGAVVAKTTVPPVAFIFSEPNMVNAFWDYMGRNTFT